MSFLKPSGVEASRIISRNEAKTNLSLAKTRPGNEGRALDFAENMTFGPDSVWGSRGAEVSRLENIAIENSGSLGQMAIDILVNAVRTETFMYVNDFSEIPNKTREQQLKAIHALIDSLSTVGSNASIGLLKKSLTNGRFGSEDKIVVGMLEHKKMLEGSIAASESDEKNLAGDTAYAERVGEGRGVVSRMDLLIERIARRDPSLRDIVQKFQEESK